MLNQRVMKKESTDLSKGVVVALLILTLLITMVSTVVVYTTKTITQHPPQYEEHKSGSQGTVGFIILETGEKNG